MSNLSLYHIETEYQRLMDAVNDADGEITDEQFSALQINKDQLQHKGIQYTMIIKDQAGDIEKIDKEIARLSKLKASREKGNERLKAIITEAMKLYGVSEIKGDNFRLSFRKSTALKITDEKQIPAKYWEKVPATKALVKADVKKSLVDGKKVPGAELTVNEYNLQIK